MLDYVEQWHSSYASFLKFIFNILFLRELRD